MLNLSIIIVNYNTKALTLDCLASIFNNKWNLKLETWLVDNASTDSSVSEIRKKYPQVKIIESATNLGFAEGHNLALKKAYKNSSYCFLLNSDTRLHKGSLDNLVDFANKNGLDIASCKLEDVNGNLQPNTGALPTFLPLMVWLSGLDDILRNVARIPSYQEMDRKVYTKPFNSGWVSGTAMLIRCDTFDKIGFLDGKIFMYAEDVDYCWRANKAGLKVGWTNAATITHLGGGSQKEVKYSQWLGEFRGLLYLYKKHYGNRARFVLKMFFYFFISLRVLAFFLLGKFGYAKAYAKILREI